MRIPHAVKLTKPMRVGPVHLIAFHTNYVMSV